MVQKKLLDAGDVKFASVQSCLETFGNFSFPSHVSETPFDTFHDFIVFSLF